MSVLDWLNKDSYLCFMKLRFSQTRDIKEFRPLIDNLIEDFDFVFLHTILQWCKLANDSYEESKQFWELWIVQKSNSFTPPTTIGICGLYSLTPNSTERLWLGWLGIIPQHRNKGEGKDVMQFLYKEAKKAGCKELLSYVGKEGKPLSFYKREGFEILGTVKEYVEANKELNVTANDFEDEDDYVIRKFL